MNPLEQKLKQRALDELDNFLQHRMASRLKPKEASVEVDAIPLDADKVKSFKEGLAGKPDAGKPPTDPQAPQADADKNSLTPEMLEKLKQLYSGLKG